MSWGFRVCVFERSEFTPASLSEHRKEPMMIFIMGKYAGALSFGYLFFEQAKKSDSPQGAKNTAKFKQTNKDEPPPVRQHKKLKKPQPHPPANPHDMTT